MNEYFSEVEKLVQQFEGTSLAEMDSVKLMNRTDTKFILNIEQFPDILRDAIQYYKILEIDNGRLQKYETTYFDTSDFLMFSEHQEGKLNRYKVRRREYCVSGETFLEVKFKNNKSRTIKKRIKRAKSEPNFDETTRAFMEKHFPKTSQDNLEVKLTNFFTRIMLVHKTAKERITLDMNLGFRNESKITQLPFLVIAEVKQEGYSSMSTFIQILRKYKIAQTGMSKYCIGTILLHPEIKHNSFKKKLLKLNRLNKNESGDYSNLFAKNR